MESQKSRMTCHYFSEESGEFLFSRDLIPTPGEDYCDRCGQDLTEDGDCVNGTQHYWCQFIEE